MSATSASELATVPLFRTLSEDELGDVAELFDARTVGPNTRLIGEGTTGMVFFVLTAGNVAVTTPDGRTVSLGPGDYFGEVALLTGGRRTASVTTVSEARVLVLAGDDDFRRLTETYPELGAEIEETSRLRLAAS